MLYLHLPILQGTTGNVHNSLKCEGDKVVKALIQMNIYLLAHTKGGH